MSTDIDILRGEHMKQGDTMPALRAMLVEDDNEFNLSEYTVTMKMKLANADSLTVDDSVTIEQPDRGIVTYDWNSGDTEMNGTYNIEFVAEHNDGNKLSFPNNGFGRVYIEEGL
jgi:hypothetical protein